MADADGNAYGPYDIDVPGSESEPFTETNWFRLNRDSGLTSGGGITFAGLTAQLAPFEGLVHGSFLARTSPWTDASPPTTTSAPRRDLLVARRRLTTGSGATAVPGKTYLQVLRGTPAAVPVDPDHDLVNDEPLWSWQVPGSGGNTITAVRDRRPFLRGWTSWTPVFNSASGGPVTFGAGALIDAKYEVKGRRIKYTVAILCGTNPNGGIGAITLQLPAGAVNAGPPTRGSGVMDVFHPGIGSPFMGRAIATAGNATVELLMPKSYADCTLDRFRNATAASTAGTGVPLIAGSYPLITASQLRIEGEHEIVTAPNWA